MDREEEWPGPALSKQDVKRLLEMVVDLARIVDEAHPDKKTQQVYDLALKRLNEF